MPAAGNINFHLLCFNKRQSNTRARQTISKMKLLCKPTTLNEVMLRKSQEKILQNVQLSQDRSAINPNSTCEEQVPQCPHRVLIIVLQKLKVSCCITPVTNSILKYSSAAFLSTTNITVELAHESLL